MRTAMTSISVLPSTLDGLRRLAKNIERADSNLTHLQALEQAAVRCGYNNFTDAKRRMGRAPAGAPGAPLFDVYLTAYWRSFREPEKRTLGRETLHVRIARALPTLVNWRQLDSSRHLGGFRFEYEDHLELRVNQGSPEEARARLFAAARTLHFMDTTGLRPATRRADRMALGIDDMPQRDHTSDWVDAQTGERLGLDEPYPHVDPHGSKRVAWLEERGLQLFAPAWEGLYAPGHSRPYLVVAEAALGQRVVAQVEALQKAMPAHLEASSVVSAKFWERFVSPARAAAGKPASARIMPAYPGTERAGAVAYGGRAGEKGRWRPARAMPFELHEKASTLLQTTTYSGQPWRAYELVNEVKSELEDWVFKEHPDIMSGRDDVYYGANFKHHQHPVSETIPKLAEILRSGYADCSPRREMLRKLERAQALIQLPGRAIRPNAVTSGLRGKG